MLTSKKFKERLFYYLERAHTGVPGEYRNSLDGHVTLYASCFALMLYHYLDEIKRFNSEYLRTWGRYIQNFQDSQSGYFLGPEITKGRLLSKFHSSEHLSEHLTAHVLPALGILGIKPIYPLQFAFRYADEKVLKDWLSKRDWNNAWLEGNNLLFVGEFLTHMYEAEGNNKAKDALSILFKWLDNEIDPETGLWGTNGYCDKYSAVYGGYHQLLLYYYWGHDIKHKERLVDTVLLLQHKDGGFAMNWGGGTCQDVDAVDILVNMYKQTNYRRDDILVALKRAYISIMKRFTIEGGFVDRRWEEFRHMGMEYTYASKNKANMFSTWFGVHTLFLISEVINLSYTKRLDYGFNTICSMGWHKKSVQRREPFWSSDWHKILITIIIDNLYYFARNIKESSPVLNTIYARLKKLIRK